jgi:hypothetical protein
LCRQPDLAPRFLREGAGGEASEKNSALLLLLLLGGIIGIRTGGLRVGVLEK